MKSVANTIKTILPLAAAIVCIYGVVYLAMQQYIRLSANELPLQYAENVRIKLQQGMTIQHSLEDIELTGMEASLMPFVMICDKDGKIIQSTSALYASHPVPFGVLAVAKQNGENRRTWQPKRDIRNTIVVLPWTISGKEGYVIAGRSMRETEKREQFFLGQMVTGLIVTLLVTFVCAFAVQRSQKEPAAAI